jgi:hypothetical protein
MRGSSWRWVALILVGTAPGPVLACADILDVEAGILDDAASDASVDADATTRDDAATAADTGEAMTGEGQSDSGGGDAGEVGPTACDAGARDAATAGFAPWYALGGATFPADAAIAAVTPATAQVALYGTDTNGHVLGARAAAPFGQAGWTPWKPVTTAKPSLAPGAPVSAAAGASGEVDLFAVKGGSVVTVTAGSNGDWTTLSAGSSSPAFAPQRIAVAHTLTQLHLFAIAGGAVYEATRQDAAADFSAWSAIGGADGGASPSFPATNSALAVVEQNATALDVIAPASDGRIYVVARAPADPGWGPWVPLSGLTLSPGTAVGATSHIPGEYDVFTFGSTDNVMAIYHNASLNGGFFGWFAVGTTVAEPGSPFVVTPTFDLFMIDLTGAVTTLPWDYATNSSAQTWVAPAACGQQATSLTAQWIPGLAMELVAVDPQGIVHVADRIDGR